MTSPPGPLAVCVYCASSRDIDAAYVDLAAAVGTEIGRRGHSLVSGGGRVSSMGAVATAARAAGARTVGVIPETMLDWEVADTAADELVVTATMRERKAVMEERADGFVALPGGLGTLEELFEIWTGRVLGLHSKPVVVLDPGGLFAPLRAQLDLLVERRFARPRALEAVRWTTTAAEAIDAVEAGAASPETILAPPSLPTG